MSSVKNTKSPKGAVRASKTERRHNPPGSTFEQRARSESPCANRQMFEPSDVEELNGLRNARARATEMTPTKKAATTKEKAAPAPKTVKRIAPATVKKLKIIMKTPVQTKLAVKEPNPEIYNTKSDGEVDDKVVEEERNRPKLVPMSARKPKKQGSSDAKPEPGPEKPKAPKSTVKKGKKVPEPESEPKLEQDANKNYSEYDAVSDSPLAQKAKEVKSKADALKREIATEGKNRRLASPEPQSPKALSSDNVNGKRRKHAESDSLNEEAEINGESGGEHFKEDDLIANIKPAKTPAKNPRKTPAKTTSKTPAKTLVKTPRKKANASEALDVVKAGQDANSGPGDESSLAANKQKVSAAPARERNPPIISKRTPAKKTETGAAPPMTPKSPRRNARTKPKAPPRNPYLLFCASSPRDELLMKYPKMNKQDLVKNLGKMWKKMEADEDDTILQYEVRLEVLKSAYEKNIVLWENGQLNGKDEELN